MKQWFVVFHILKFVSAVGEVSCLVITREVFIQSARSDFLSCLLALLQKCLSLVYSSKIIIFLRTHLFDPILQNRSDPSVALKNMSISFLKEALRMINYFNCLAWSPFQIGHPRPLQLRIHGSLCSGLSPVESNTGLFFILHSSAALHFST